MIARLFVTRTSCTPLVFKHRHGIKLNAALLYRLHHDYKWCRRQTGTRSSQQPPRATVCVSAHGSESIVEVVHRTTGHTPSMRDSITDICASSRLGSQESRSNDGILASLSTRPFCFMLATNSRSDSSTQHQTFQG